jgi:hypothetical protein
MARGTWRLALKVLTGWLAVEFGAAVTAVTIVVALGPLVVILLLDPGDLPLTILGVLSVSVPVAAFLGTTSIRLSWELIRQARNL